MDLNTRRTHKAERSASFHLRMLGAFAPARSLFDVRYRTPGGALSRLFLPVGAAQAPRTIVRLGQAADVYVGCAPRTRRRGRRQDVAPTALLWADCDGPDAFAALLSFKPAASVIVASGSDYGAHAYWALTQALGVGELEDANRRLAAALGADPRCADAARVLRVPGTKNFKHHSPRPVEMLRCTSIRYPVSEILDVLPAAPAPSARPPRARSRSSEGDPLLEIEPARYFHVLTGLTPNRDRKVRCPFHADDTPSLHIYDTPQRGWACFGCQGRCGRPLGGDIYTLASLVWDIPSSGREFVALRARLGALFGVRRD